MYVGRLLVVAPGLGAYRVSSRSFPDRRIADRNGEKRRRRLAVVPTGESPDNPYVSYTCLRQVEGEPLVAVGNGSQVDPVAEKLALGYPPRDALAEVLLALDFERDDYDTPRIAGVVGPDRATVGVVRRDALLVEAVDRPTLVATYERDSPEPFEFEAHTAAGAAREAYDLAFEHPVCAAGVAVSEGSVDVAVENGPG